MTDSINAISVYYNGFNEHKLVGKLMLNANKPVFGYDIQWLHSGLQLSPVTMANSNQLFYGQHANSLYLCGLLADSLPDGWGMLLMDRFFRKEFNKQRHEISVLERFAYIGSSDRIIGALTFEPEHNHDNDNFELDLLAMATANEQILAGHDTDILQELLIMGGSAQGARPKSLLYYDPKTEIISTQAQSKHQSNLQPWLIKFPAQGEDKSVCLLESLYADYAIQAGLTVPPHRYFDISDTQGAFAVQRFDRMQSKENDSFERIHVQTLAGLLDIDFRVPSIDYIQYLRCVRMLTKSQQQVEQAYRQVVFNVLFNNKDDHSKNFSFIMDRVGNWSLAPAYDITYNTGINGYHQMDVCGEAKQPTHQQLLQLAKRADIKQNTAQAIIDEVVTVAEKMLKEIKHHAIASELCEQVSKDVGANVGRVV